MDDDALEEGCVMLSSVRDTSLMAYIEIEPELGARQMHVLSVLRERGSLTNTELSQVLNWTINRVTPRIFELRALGCVILDCKRSCRVTGRQAYSWRVFR